MRSHPTSGSPRTPDASEPRRAPSGDIRQFTPATVEGRNTAIGRPRLDDPRDLLLTTKQAIPLPRAQMLARPRLTDRLEQGLARKLTLVAAPAGYGKTSLLAAWAAEKAKGKRQRVKEDVTADETVLPFTFSLLPSNVAWLTLDAADNDPQHFWAYVISGLKTLHPDLAVPVLDLLRETSIEATLTVLLNALAELPERLILVLDDYHAITTPAIHQALTFLLDHLPPQLHLVLAGRSTPPLPIARMRARAELVQLGAGDLRFTLEEATVLLQQRMGLDLADTDIAALTERTAGWITGLHLAGLAQQDEVARHTSHVTVRGSDHYLFDYLIEEVLQQQPMQIQTFLLQTAILDRLNGDLCDVVLGGEDAQSPMPSAQSILDELERANLFIIPLDAERRWYRYHPLFSEALRAFLQHTQPALVPELQRRATAWYEANQIIPDAALPGWEALPDSTAIAANPLLEPLSPRELDVLRLVTEGLSNQAVAEALIIGVGTVKSHLLNIYAKLVVHNRTQAVARARALGLM